MEKCVESQAFIKRGVKWLVATGEKIDICDQLWLEDAGNPYASTRTQVL